MKNTHIQWADHTFNPWEGCTKVSPGCANCYAETRNKRWNKGSAPNWGKGAPRRRTSVHNWNDPLRWNRIGCGGCDPCIAGQQCYMVAHPRVFCASLADWLDEEVPIEWLVDLLALIHKTPNLTWMVLSKRPENWRERLNAVRSYCLEGRPVDGGPLELHSFVCRWISRDDATPPENIWIGTTVEDQQCADERIPLLLDIPAKVRFLSCEPLLGPVDLSEWVICPNAREGLSMDPTTGAHECCRKCDYTGVTGAIDWCIVGGESGPHARPMHPAWARSLRDQCKAAGVAFHFKQYGCFRPTVAEDFEPGAPGKMGWVQLDGKSYWAEHPKHPSDELMLLTSKEKAGRLLDGVEHNELPQNL